MKNTLQDRLGFILKHAYENAPAVHKLFNEAELTPDDIHTLADLDKIPVTTKDRLVELQMEHPPFGGFLAVPPETLEHIFFSPGPLYEPHAGESAVIESAREILDIADFRAGDVVLNSFGYHLIPTGLAVDQVSRENGITVIPAGVGNADLLVKMMLDLKVTGYLGTPSWLMALIKKAEEMGMDFQKQFSLSKAIVSAEPLPPEMRAAFVDTYKLAVTNAYATAELGVLAYNTEGGLAMKLLESSIIQVANPETGLSVKPGETGEVVVTSFDETYPLIRLGTGDLAMFIDPAPGQSRQSERSIILVGRVGDAVKVRGMFVHPNQLRFVASQVPGLVRLQAVVTRPENRDQFNLRVVLADETAGRDALTAALSEAIRSTCRVSVDQIEIVSDSDLGQGAQIIIDERSWE
jgi:phenylacetate-CoA ligase